MLLSWFRTRRQCVMRWLRGLKRFFCRNSTTAATPVSFNAKKLLHQNTESIQKTCPICLEDVITSEGKILLDPVFISCKHVYCFRCLVLYVQSCITQGNAEISCPLCPKRLLTTEDIKELCLSRESFEKYNNLLLKQYLQDKSKFFHCPTPGCENVLEKRQEGNDLYIQCNHCEKFYCIICSEDHDAKKISCGTFQVWKRRNGMADDLFKELKTQRKWMSCPKCAATVERTDGCNHIKCRCGFEACYACGRAWGNGHMRCTGV